jgi:hypothetical protein
VPRKSTESRRTPSVHPRLELRIADAATAEKGTIFGYTITHPEVVRAAWIEVLDCAVLLDRKEIKVQASGEINGAWDDSGLGYLAEPEDVLFLSIWDPHCETTCDVNTVMTTRRDGGLVSGRTIGSRSNFAPAQMGLDELFLRVPQEHPQLVLTMPGSDLLPGAKFTVKPVEGAACDDSSVHSEILDLSHARLTVSSVCFRKPGVISIFPVDTPDYYAPVQISIASKQSPVLRSVSPTVDRSDPLIPSCLRSPCEVVASQKIPTSI